MSPTPIF